jgi:ABC-type transport system substrate-binding protein
MPGYDSSNQGYEYDPEKAKALLAEAGFADGFETSIECISVEPQPKLCESFQQDLDKIGITLTINTLAAPNVIEDAGNGKTPLTWSGGLAWIQDYPDPDDFYAPILGRLNVRAAGFGRLQRELPEKTAARPTGPCLNWRATKLDG